MSDAPEITRMAGEWGVADTCQIPHPYPQIEAEEWIGSQQAAFDRREEMALGIFNREFGMVVGTVTLAAIFEGHQAELGFWIGKEFWGHGYATEASRAIIEYGFEQFHLIRVHACHLSRNGASGKVLAKIGMIHEGCSPKHLLKWGIPEDVDFWGIVRDGDPE